MIFANINNQTDNRKQDTTNKWRQRGGGWQKIQARLFAYVVKLKALPQKVLKCTDKNTKGPEVVVRVTICFKLSRWKQVKVQYVNFRML